MITGNYSLQSVRLQPDHHFTVFHHPLQGPTLFRGWDEDSLHHEYHEPDYLTWPYPIHYTAFRKLHHFRDQTFHSFTLLHRFNASSGHVRAHTAGYEANPSTTLNPRVTDSYHVTNKRFIRTRLLFQLIWSWFLKVIVILLWAKQLLGLEAPNSLARSSKLELVIQMIILI